MVLLGFYFFFESVLFYRGGALLDGCRVMIDSGLVIL
jgi:hypothetical protein